MSIKYKKGAQERVAGSDRVILELGCGASKRHADAIGIDALDYPGVDIVGDVYEALGSFPSGRVDAVYSYHFVEHVSDVGLLMRELSRIVKVGGAVEVVAPHFSNPYFYSDPTHRGTFGLYTFSYLALDSSLRRKVPTYQKALSFRVESARLGFKSSRPFIGRHVIKRAIGFVFDSCIYMRELYEENFCFLFPCYEVTYRLIRMPSQEPSVD